MLNREHWLEKLSPADTSIFYLLPGNSLACFSLEPAKGCCGMTLYRRLNVPVYVEDCLAQPCPARGAGSAHRCPGSRTSTLV